MKRLILPVAAAILLGVGITGTGAQAAPIGPAPSAGSHSLVETVRH
jgi:hypothetical protein